MGPVKTFKVVHDISSAASINLVSPSENDCIKPSRAGGVQIQNGTSLGRRTRALTLLAMTVMTQL